MKKNSDTNVQQGAGPRFDFFRLSKSKECVDASPNTLRKYHEEDGLPFYQRKGERAVWVSYTEVEAVISKHRMVEAAQ